MMKWLLEIVPAVLLLLLGLYLLWRLTLRVRRWFLRRVTRDELTERRLQRDLRATLEAEAAAEERAASSKTEPASNGAGEQPNNDKDPT